MKYYSSDPIGFRSLPNSPIVRLSHPQHRRLARYFAEQRKMVRKVLTSNIICETEIQEAKARISEMRALGFIIVKIDQEKPRKGDRRKRYILADTVILVESDIDGDGDVA